MVSGNYFISNKILYLTNPSERRDQWQRIKVRRKLRKGREKGEQSQSVRRLSLEMRLLP
jgi:hypothetical protein